MTESGDGGRVPTACVVRKMNAQCENSVRETDTMLPNWGKITEHNENFSKFHTTLTLLPKFGTAAND